MFLYLLFSASRGRKAPMPTKLLLGGAIASVVAYGTYYLNELRRALRNWRNDNVVIRHCDATEDTELNACAVAQLSIIHNNNDNDKHIVTQQQLSIRTADFTDLIVVSAKSLLGRLSARYRLVID